MLHEILIRESALNKFSQKSYSRLTLSCALLFYFPLRPSLFVLLLTEPHSLRLLVLEADHSVFPVTDMVPDVPPNVHAAEVEGIEVEVEDVDSPVAVVVNDDCR